MQKTAQKRSLLNKLREVTDIGGIATEKYFNPEFKQIMDQLREIDDGIRAIASGEQVGDASPPADAVSLKDLLKSAKSNMNRREYMKTIADLGRFHRKIFDIVHLLSLFRSNVDKVHEKFLFHDLDEDSKKHLQYFKDKWSKKNASHNVYFIKEANILDFFTNIATERGRALAAWEKRYPNKVKKLKIDTTTMLSLSEKLLNIILSSLKNMAKARASRSPDNYIAASDKIISTFKSYDEGERGFRQFYENNVKGFLEKQEFFAPTKIDDTDKPQDLGKKEIAVEPASPIPSTNQSEKSSIPNEDLTSTIVDAPKIFPTQLPQSSPSPPLTKIPLLPPIPKLVSPKLSPFSPQSPGNISNFDETKTTQSEIKISSIHRKFINSLESMSEESPILLSSHISRYAKSIWLCDPDTAIKLFKIAKSIKG